MPSPRPGGEGTGPMGVACRTKAELVSRHRAVTAAAATGLQRREAAAQPGLYRELLQVLLLHRQAAIEIGFGGFGLLRVHDRLHHCNVPHRMIRKGPPVALSTHCRVPWQPSLPRSKPSHAVGVRLWTGALAKKFPRIGDYFFRCDTGRGGGRARANLDSGAEAAGDTVGTGARAQGQPAPPSGTWAKFFPDAAAADRQVHHATILVSLRSQILT
jgi:hypothetical protein